MSEPVLGVSPGRGVTGAAVFATLVLVSAGVVGRTGAGLALAFGTGAGAGAGGVGAASGAGRAAPRVAGAATSSTAYIGGEALGPAATDKSSARIAPTWIRIVPVRPAQNAPLGSRSARTLSGGSPLLRW